jgi:hypothetical protein
MLRKLAFALVLSAAFSSAYARVFELRTYTAAPGKLPAVQARFRDVTAALFKKHGFEIVAFWVPQDAPRSENTFVYMLAFPDRETAKARWADFQKDPDWIKARADSEKDGKLVDKVESQFLSPLDFSPMK